MQHKNGIIRKGDRMSYWDKQDVYYLVIFVISFIVLGFLAAGQLISRQVTLVASISLAALAVANPLLKEKLLRDFGSRLNKGVRDYWAEIVKEIRETSGKFDFHYNLNLPLEYMPENKIELFERGLVLYEINRQELVLGFGEEYSQSQGRERLRYLTIIYHVQRQKIIGSIPLSLQDTIVFIKNNKEYFSEESTMSFFPQTIKETSFGQPVKVKSPKVET